MPIINSLYKGSPWVRGKHMETIVPALFRKVEGIVYLRERMATPDQDFIDLDWSTKGHKRLAIISHGLEGNTNKHYIRGMAKELNAEGWDALTWNHRSCSGELNKVPGFYHAGSTEDLNSVIKHALGSNRYTEIVLIGFSLGGNIILKYLGERGEAIPKEISKATVFSVGCDIYALVQTLSEGFNKVYVAHFMYTLKDKAKKKAELYPDLIPGINWKKVKTITDFDDHFTAPVCGFKDAIDYYTECSIQKNIPHIRIPTLIVTAENDPFMNKKCFPIEECKNSPYVFLEIPPRGGHLGFMKDSLNGRYWSEERTIAFLKEAI